MLRRQNRVFILRGRLVQGGEKNRLYEVADVNAVHRTLAATIVSIAIAQRRSVGVDTVGLTGGVFQNALADTGKACVELLVADEEGVVLSGKVYP